MKAVEVKICVCTQCVMNGAMDLIEAVESLDSIKYSFEVIKLNIISDSSICKTKPDFHPPVVIIDGEMIEGATAEIVTEMIVAKCRAASKE